MFRQYLQNLSATVGAGPAKWLLLAAPLLVFLALLILGSGFWRKRLAAQEAGSGWRAWLAGGLAASLKLSTGLLGVGFLCLSLLVQAGLFNEHHGRVTERNLEAVKSKWGAPHEQRELIVRQTVRELVTDEEFAGGGKRHLCEPSAAELARDEDEAVLSDELFPVEMDDKGKPKNPMAVAHRVKKLVRKTLPQEAITSALVNIDLNSNPRFLGGAGYAGFEDNCHFEYAVVNRAAQPTRAEFEFALPAGGGGVFNRLSVKVDGREAIGEVRLVEGALRWERPLAPGAALPVEIAYQSRGLEYFRYYPGELRANCAIKMRVRGVPREKLNFPIGSMSPDDDLNLLSGEDYTLHWDLANGVTNLSTGIIVPSPEQPGIETARILREAPLGLALLALLLAATRLLLGSSVGFFNVGLALLLHFLAYAAFASACDLTSSFGLAVLAGMALPALAGAAFWVGHDGWNLSGVQSGLLFALFTLGYPLAVKSADYAGIILNTAYVLLAVYVMLLIVLARWRGACFSFPTRRGLSC